MSDQGPLSKQGASEYSRTQESSNQSDDKGVRYVLYLPLLIMMLVQPFLPPSLLVVFRTIVSLFEGSVSSRLNPFRCGVSCVSGSILQCKQLHYMMNCPTYGQWPLD